MKLRTKTLFLLSLLPLFLACDKDDFSSGTIVSAPSDSSTTDTPKTKIQVEVDFTLSSDTAVVGELITIEDTLTEYNPEYELFLGTEFGFFFRNDIVEPLESNSFTKRFANNGVVRLQKSKDPMVEFSGSGKAFTFKQLQVNKVTIDQVPPLPDEFPNISTLSNGEVVVYLAEDTERYTRTYVLSDLRTYLLGEKEVEIKFENRGRNDTFFPRGGIDRFLLLNQSNMRLVIAYEHSEALNSVRNTVIAMSEPFNPYDLAMDENNIIRVEDTSLGLNGFSFEFQCQWVTF